MLDNGNNLPRGPRMNEETWKSSYSHCQHGLTAPQSVIPATYYFHLKTSDTMASSHESASIRKCNGWVERHNTFGVSHHLLSPDAPWAESSRLEQLCEAGRHFAQFPADGQVMGKPSTPLLPGGVARCYWPKSSQPPWTTSLRLSKATGRRH